MEDRIVIITNGNYFARLILSDVFQQRADDIFGVLVVTGDYKARDGLRALWEVSKVTAFPYLTYKLMTILAFVIAQRLYVRSLFSVESLAAFYSIPVRSVVAVNSEEALAWVAEWNPDLLVSVSCPQMIKRKMLSLARLGGINIHSSLLPSYAGLAPYFWVLSQGEEITGVTVHYITSKFDAGNILVQKQLTIEPGESAFHLFKRLAILGSSCLKEAVQMAFNGFPGQKQDSSRYSYYSHPTFGAYRELRRRGHVLMRLSELLDVIKKEAHQPVRDSIRHRCDAEVVSGAQQDPLQ